MIVALVVRRIIVLVEFLEYVEPVERADDGSRSRDRPAEATLAGARALQALGDLYRLRLYPEFNEERQLSYQSLARCYLPTEKNLH